MMPKRIVWSVCLFLGIAAAELLGRRAGGGLGLSGTLQLTAGGNRAGNDESLQQLGELDEINESLEDENLHTVKDLTAAENNPAAGASKAALEKTKSAIAKAATKATAKSEQVADPPWVKAQGAMTFNMTFAKHLWTGTQNAASKRFRKVETVLKASKGQAKVAACKDLVVINSITYHPSTPQGLATLKKLCLNMQGKDSADSIKKGERAIYKQFYRPYIPGLEDLSGSQTCNTLDPAGAGFKNAMHMVNMVMHKPENKPGTAQFMALVAAHGQMMQGKLIPKMFVSQKMMCCNSASCVTNKLCEPQNLASGQPMDMCISS